MEAFLADLPVRPSDFSHRLVLLRRLEHQLEPTKTLNDIGSFSIKSRAVFRELVLKISAIDDMEQRRSLFRGGCTWTTPRTFALGVHLFKALAIATITKATKNVLARLAPMVAKKEGVFSYDVPSSAPLNVTPIPLRLRGLVDFHRAKPLYIEPGNCYVPYEVNDDLFDAFFLTLLPRHPNPARQAVHQHQYPVP